MKLSKEDIAKFKKIWKKEFGKEISDQESYERGTKLINLVKIVYKTHSRKKLNKISKNN